MSSDDSIECLFPGDEEGIGQFMHFMRGQIVAFYAQVEYAFTDLIARCMQIDCYKHFAHVPYRVKGRLEMVRRIFREAGPLKAYEAEISPLIDILLDWEHVRHLMAHSIAFFEYNEHDPKMTMITFQKFEPFAKSFRMDKLECTARMLEEKTLEIGRYSTRVITYVAKIVHEQQLSHINIMWVPSEEG